MSDDGNNTKLAEVILALSLYSRILYSGGILEAPSSIYKVKKTVLF